MKYCVVRNTTTVIDGSENSIEIMLQNAQNAGFSKDEVEVLTEEEYQARRVSEPVEPSKPTVSERLEALEQAMLELILGGVE